MHEVLANRLGGINLPRKSVVRIIDRPDMTFDVTVDVKQQYNNNNNNNNNLKVILGKVVRLRYCIIISLII